MKKLIMLSESGMNPGFFRDGASQAEMTDIQS